MKLTFAHLHIPLFFNSKNWGDKLETKNTQKGKFDIDLKWVNIDGKEELFLVISQDKKEQLIPLSNVGGMTVAPQGTDALKHEVELPMLPKQVPGSIPMPKPKKSAQVSGPHDHVFAGQGAGKVNDKQ